MVVHNFLSIYPLDYLRTYGVVLEILHDSRKLDGSSLSDSPETEEDLRRCS